MIATLAGFFSRLFRTAPASTPRCDGCGHPVVAGPGPDRPHRTPWGRWICAACQASTPKADHV